MLKFRIFFSPRKLARLSFKKYQRETFTVSTFSYSLSGKRYRRRSRFSVNSIDTGRFRIGLVTSTTTTDGNRVSSPVTQQTRGPKILRTHTHAPTKHSIIDCQRFHDDVRIGRRALCTRREKNDRNARTSQRRI